MENKIIVEFGTYIAGPLVGWHLQSLGAKVYCITRPLLVRGAKEEILWCPRVTNFLRSGKEIVEIDLRNNPSKAWDLIKTADVVVENFRPNVMKKLGFGAEACRKVNPSLIYVSLPGFASTDIELSKIPAWESIMMATAGIFRDMGLNRQLMHIPASFSPLPLASVYSSVLQLYLLWHLYLEILVLIKWVKKPGVI